MGGELERWSARNPADKRRALLVGAGVAAVAVAGTIAYVVITAPSRKRKPKPKPKDCPAGPGTFRGIEFDELVTGGADPSETLPMVVAFHGRGGTPKLMRSIMEKLPARARVIVPQGPLSLGKNFMWWKTRSAGDQGELAENMTQAAEIFGPWVQDLALCRPTRGRPVVAGHSQGGMMALGIASSRPQRIHAAVAGSAWMPPAMWPGRKAPARLLHGDKDTIVNFSRTEAMVKELASRGHDWELKVIKDHGHGISGRLQDEWLKRIAQTAKGVS